MYKWVCQMFYKDKLYTGYYWGDELSLARARKKVVEMQRMNPSSLAKEIQTGCW